eukprot:4635841-Prymnesium_polylepis.3
MDVCTRSEQLCDALSRHLFDQVQRLVLHGATKPHEHLVLARCVRLPRRHVASRVVLNCRSFRVNGIARSAIRTQQSNHGQLVECACAHQGALSSPCRRVHVGVPFQQRSHAVNLAVRNRLRNRWHPVIVSPVGICALAEQPLERPRIAAHASAHHGMQLTGCSADAVDSTQNLLENLLEAPHSLFLRSALHRGHWLRLLQRHRDGLWQYRWGGVCREFLAASPVLPTEFLAASPVLPTLAPPDGTF